ncbi:glycosyltransferase family 2 protein [Flavobacterium hiemivividum]|uniref:Glycosyltransferase n=1 Tax=Flavobacterium hiemivividum TaxID=2541734 RepID=A0A4R5CZL3_9FLAO|nr:glycosyltransferase [Flavobacterium hiemivividum]TDE04581.1 glycosyltransferase [Flavobacterium hiemivividum]
MLEDKMEIKPLISIILPVYNGEKYIEEAIESCLSQTYSNIELIIVNDCSTDRTLEICHSYVKKDDRIKLINNDINLKLPVSLNVGHRAAKGDFLTWTSDDNYYKTAALETLINIILEKQVDVAYSDLISIDENGELIGEVNYVGFENIVFGNFVGASFLYKKEVFQRNKGFNEKLYLVEDYDFWLRAMIHSKFYQVNEKLYFYRKHEDSLTHQIKFTKDAKRLWKDNLKKMFANYCVLIEGNENEEIASFLAKRMSYQQIPFDWWVQNHKLISKFKNKLKCNVNFISDNTLIEKAFFNKTIEALRQDVSNNSRFLNALFIIRKYSSVLNGKGIKAMIKHILTII